MKSKFKKPQNLNNQSKSVNKLLVLQMIFKIV